MTTHNTETKVAETILEQMGGASRIRAMTGAKTFVVDPSGVSFRFPNRGARKPNYVCVALDLATDTYSVEFGRIFKKGGVPTYAKLASFNGIYCDALVRLFEDQTGLYLSL